MVEHRFRKAGVKGSTPFFGFLRFWAAKQSDSHLRALIVAVGGVLLMGTSPWGFRLVLAGLALTGLSSRVLAMLPALVWLFYGVAVLTVGFLAYSLWVNRKALIGAVGLVEKIKPLVPEGTVSGTAAELHTPLVSKVIDKLRAK